MAIFVVARYTSNMQTVIRNVRELSGTERSAAEQLVGRQLCENQQLVIQVVNIDVAADGDRAASDDAQLPEWCNVYAGLTDEQIAALERAISRRLDLTGPAM